MDFDLRSCDSAYKFILNFMRMTPGEFITERIIYCDCEFEKLWARNITRIQEDISQLRIMGFHILGSLDDCGEIKKNGLWNLQKVLSNDTTLSDLLKKQGIYIDVSNKILRVGSKRYDIDYENYRHRPFLNENEELLSDISRRIYYDYCVNGFLANDDVFNYGTQIHERPEFLMILSRLLPEAGIVEEYWRTHAKSYQVDFFVTMDQVHRFNFELDEYRDPPYEGWVELDDDMKMKKWMLSHAIDRAYNNLGEVYLYIKDNIIIPPEQIISYSKLKI